MKRLSETRLITILSAVSGLGYFILSGVIDNYLRNPKLPESYIGMESLIEIRNYLSVYLCLKIMDIVLFLLFVIFLCLMIIPTGEKIKFSECLKSILVIFLIAGLCVGAFTLTDTRRNQFDWQMYQNQYHGTLMMKTCALLRDIEQDLKENTTETVNIIPVCTSADFQYHVNAGKGNSGYDVHVLEYAVYTSDNEEYISQISRKDYAKYNVLFRGDTPHEIKLYPHSGFIASVD